MGSLYHGIDSTVSQSSGYYADALYLGQHTGETMADNRRMTGRTLRAVAGDGGDKAGQGGLTHVDARGRIRMVDVGDKAVTRREAVARGAVRMAPATVAAIVAGRLKKGEALAAARIAGIMAAKRTHELIPLCHQIPLEVVEVDFRPNQRQGVVEVQARAVTSWRTGVEMEALVAVSAAALALYDMAKAIDRAMVIDAVRLVSKEGGRSGVYHRSGEKIWRNEGPRQ
jgi:cyclic pyranopterin monophosphate synthase